MAGSAFETPMYQYVHATGVAMGITPAEPSLSGLRRKNPLLQRQITRFDSAEYFLGKEGKKPTDGLCLVSDHAPPPPKPRFVDCSTAPASRNSRLRGCSQ